MKQAQRNLIPVCPTHPPIITARGKRNFTPPRTGNPKRNATFSERETAYEITDAVLRAGDRLVIPGQCDREIGTEAPPQTIPPNRAL